MAKLGEQAGILNRFDVHLRYCKRYSITIVSYRNEGISSRWIARHCLSHSMSLESLREGSMPRKRSDATANENHEACTFTSCDHDPAGV